MKRNKKQKFLDNKYNRAIIVALEFASLFTIVVVVCLVLHGDIISTADEKKPYLLQNQQNSDTTHEYDTQYAVTKKDGENNSGHNLSNNGITQSAKPNAQQQSPFPYSENNTVNSLEDASSWSTAQILSKASSAVNKTKNYSGNVSAHHQENFDATVTECSGGSIVRSVANLMVGWVVEPVDETLGFSGGSAVNSEGETIPVLLPKKGGFTLSQGGVSNASARTVGNEYVVNLGIVPESVDMYETPVHNASSVGYLDVSSFDLSFLTVDSADITYRGSSVKLHINSDGYVTYAAYRIPLFIKGSGHRGDISGSVTFEGEQTEQWTLTY